jgi:hypothetical protein
MLRKALTVSIAALFLTSSALIASPANAASVKSGQSCKKVNTTTKVKFQGDTYVYKCVKNPMYKKTSLTWTLAECLTAIKELATAKRDLATAKASGSASVDSYQQLADMSKELADMSCAKGI